MSFLLW